MTRPRSLFCRSKGTGMGVAPLAHDQFKYSICTYVAPRTLIRCKEIRPKEIIAKNKGFCEQHDYLAGICASQAEMENKLMQFEVDQMEHVDHEEALRLGEWVTDVVPFLDEKDRWVGEAADLNNMKGIKEAEDDPLSGSELVSEKEWIRAQIAAITRHTEEMKEARERNEMIAMRRQHKLHAYLENTIKEEICGLNNLAGAADLNVARTEEVDEEGETETVDKKGEEYKIGWNDIYTAYDSPADPDSELYDLVDATKRRKMNLHACSYELEVGGQKKKCTQNALPSAQLCYQHILGSSEQKTFIPCKICRAPTLDFGQAYPLCELHQNARLKSVISPGGTTRSYRVTASSLAAKNAPPWHIYDGHSPTLFNTVTMDENTVMEEREMERQEKMSMMTNPPAGQKVNQARKRSVDGVYTHKPGPQPSTMKHDPGFMAAVMGTNNAPAARRKSIPMDVTMTCARTRPFHRDEFIKYKTRAQPQMQPRTNRTMLNMVDMPHGPPAPGGIMQHPSSSHSSHPPLLSSRVSLGPSSSSSSFFNAPLPPPQPLSINSRIKPTNERPRVKPYQQPSIEGVEGGQEPSRPIVSSSIPSSSRKDALEKMYGKTPAFAPTVKREQARLPLPSPSPQIRPANRPSFPVGKSNVTLQYTTRPATVHPPPLPSSSTVSSSSVPIRPPPSKMAPSTSSTAQSRPSIPSTSRPSLSSASTSSSLPSNLPKGGLLGRKSLPTSAPPPGTLRQPFSFKPVTKGAIQMAAKSIVDDKKKNTPVLRSSVSIPKLSDESLLPTQSPSKTASSSSSSASIPNLSIKEKQDFTPITSPISSPPQLTLQKEDKTGKSISSASVESGKSSGTMISSNIPFNEQIEDIEEEDDYEEEL